MGGEQSTGLRANEKRIFDHSLSTKEKEGGGDWKTGLNSSVRFYLSSVAVFLIVESLVTAFFT